MNNDAPRYVAPPPDPGLAILTQQNQEQSNIAIQDRVSAQSARLMTMYGARMATAGDSNWSPLIVPLVGGGPLMPQSPDNPQGIGGS